MPACCIDSIPCYCCCPSWVRLILAAIYTCMTRMLSSLGSTFCLLPALWWLDVASFYNAAPVAAPAAMRLPLS
jgi:hypothetical protein